MFQAAQALGIPIKGHVEQLSLLGGAQLVSRYHGLSADHIEYLDEAGVAAMSQSGTVGVLLPGAFYFLKEQQRPPVALLRQYQVPMAVATDFNRYQPVYQPALGDEYGLRSVWLNAGRSMGGRHPSCGPGAGTSYHSWSIEGRVCGRFCGVGCHSPGRDPV